MSNIFHEAIIYQVFRFCLFAILTAILFTMKLWLQLCPWAINFFLWIICLIPIGLHLPAPISRADLFYHGLSYALVATAFFISYSNKKWIISLVLISQGILIEYIQPMTGRTFELYDMFANATGVLVALLLWSLLFRQIKRALFKKLNWSG